MARGLVAVMLHAVLAGVLVMMLISQAYAFAASFPDGGSVHSRDELYKLGPSPAIGLYALVLLGLLDLPVTGALLAHPRTRSRAWVVPLVGIALSIAVVAVAVAAFQPPPPDLGG